MTYNSLVAELQTYLERSDPDTVNSIPTFIQNAHQRICRESKNIGLEQYVTNNFIAGNPVIPKPGRWRRTLTFNFGTGLNNNTRNPIRLRSYEFLRDFWPDSTQTSPPQFYADYGWTSLLVAPTPDQAYPFEMGYLELPVPISVNQQTNWITNFAPDLLLYASLIEAEPFLRNKDDIPMWQDKYDRAIASINGQDDLRQSDRQSNRDSD